MNLCFMTINFNFFQEGKVMNVVLNVFFYRDKLSECFLTSDFRLIVNEGSSLTVVNEGSFLKTIVFQKSGNDPSL